jgi:putative transposase
MARPLRIQYPGALYHITSRGNAREPVYRSDADRQAFLLLMGDVAARFSWRFLGYCLMGNHYHLVAETVDPTLVRGMRHLNGEYTRYFNREHRRVGHVFQGRYVGILVERETQLLNLVRYVVLNPVRAGLTPRAETWAWSSHRAVAGVAAAPGWLAVDDVLRQFGATRPIARAEYARFVDEGVSGPPVWGDLRQQIYLGSEAFVDRSQRWAGEVDSLGEVPQAQRRPPRRPLAAYSADGAEPRRAMAQAVVEGGYTLAEVARHFGVHYATVSRAAARARASLSRVEGV